MIRLLLLIVLPFVAPFVIWYLWQVFGRTPKIEPATGDQEAPDIGKAPLRNLGIAGLVLMALSVGGFLAFHKHFASDPYKPISVDEYEERQKRGADNP